ncbi:MAG TPA: alpha/beta hydrolase [Prolixibacteraceae bacterium]|nr:alpha/beta hydrolase [Prolixibacteraceae bacterium]
MRNPGKNIKITSNNITISYTDEGPDNAPVIIFIHGFPFSKEMWDNQMEAFNENFRVIAYDVRGHGDSDSGTDDFSIELFVEDLLSLMDTLKIKKTSLCGLSMGGYIALKAIDNHPYRFDALILCDTSCKADSPEAKRNRMIAIESILKNGVEKFADDSLKNFFAQESFIAKKDVIAEVREIMVNTTKKSVVKTLLALSRRKETCTKLWKIKVPVLILVGEEDKITPPETAQFMHKAINGSVMSIIKNAGHLSNLENPDQFNEHLIKFLKNKII